MKKQKSTEKKLSLKKLQLVKINQMNSIMGGGGTSNSLSMNDQTTNTGPIVRKTIVTANDIQN